MDVMYMGSVWRDAGADDDLLSRFGVTDRCRRSGSSSGSCWCRDVCYAQFQPRPNAAFAVSRNLLSKESSLHTRQRNRRVNQGRTPRWIRRHFKSMTGFLHFSHPRLSHRSPTPMRMCQWTFRPNAMETLSKNSQWQTQVKFLNRPLSRKQTSTFDIASRHVINDRGRSRPRRCQIQPLLCLTAPSCLRTCAFSALRNESVETKPQS
ncbi:hypothetical protein BGW80DRAFT_262855 [Lactifluus volemus]|nr:hypothetical protein BGW80DRAFT_262855 [Lactifluus volemus]